MIWHYKCRVSGLWKKINSNYLCFKSFSFNFIRVLIIVQITNVFIYSVNNLLSETKTLSTRATVCGFSSMTRRGPVSIAQCADSQTITSDFTIGPVKVEIKRQVLAYVMKQFIFIVNIKPKQEFLIVLYEYTVPCSAN